MPSLDPQAQVLLDVAAASPIPPVYEVEVGEARHRMHAGFTQGEPEPIAGLRDFHIAGPQGGFGVRLYHPAPGQDRPGVVFFHGGGWTVNDLDTHDRLCSLLAKGADAAVISVDYRRAPEHRYPAAVDDSYTAFRWVVDNANDLAVDPEHLAVAGDSSGGTLATAVALMSRDRGGPGICAQVLIYPVTDYLDPPSSSYVERATGYSLNREFMEWSYRNYLPQSWQRDDPYLFPLQADDLSNLPATLIVTAEFDPLRDEGRQYADRLSEAGVPVEYWHINDQMHGFAMQTRAIDKAKLVVADIASYCNAILRVR